MLQRHTSGPVAQVSGYVDASFALDRDVIAEEYHNTIRSAPTRSSSYIVDHDISGRSVRSNRREELLAHRIYEAGASLSFPGWLLIDVVDFQTPLNARRGDGLGKVDLLGVGGGFCVIELKALNRSGSVDTPLNALLEAVGYCAVIKANASLVETELRDTCSRFRKNWTSGPHHRAAVAAMVDADILFLPMQDVPAGYRARIVPSKAYEYLAAGPPILAAVPEGDARDLIAEFDAGVVVFPTDATAIAEAIVGLAAWSTSGIASRPGLERFERRELSRRLAGLLEEIVRA